MRISFYSIIAFVGYGFLNKMNAFRQVIDYRRGTRDSLLLYSKKGVKKSICSDIYIPKTDGQREYYDALSSSNFIPLVVGIGPAGCGKTMFACQAAIQSLKAGLITKIVVTRPFVSVDQESMGFLPGSIEQKMSPWTRPIFDIFEEFFTKKEILELLKKSVIEMAPLAYMRGRTFRNTWIIADEMQNSSPNQMVMLLTRVGEGSRIVVTGDLYQSDLGKGNGLEDFVIKRSLVNFGSDIQVVKMESDDVQRSVFVRRVLEIYSEDKKIVDPSFLNKHSLSSNGTSNGTSVGTSNLPIINDNDCALIPKHLYNWKP